MNKITRNDLSCLDRYFFSIQNKENVTSNLGHISRVINRLFELDVNVTIVDNKTNNFFGMNVCPRSLDKYVNCLVKENDTRSRLQEMWEKETRWEIEIDSLLLYDKNLNANPGEIVAVLIHELGHVVYSNSVPSRINRVVKMELLNQDMNFRNLIRKHLRMHKIFKLSIYECCSTKTFQISKLKNTADEVNADNFAHKCGYGEELNNFISKLLTKTGNGLINRSESDMDQDVKIITSWSVNNIKLLQFRKNTLKQTLKVEKLRNPSNVVKDIIADIDSAFFGTDTDDMYKTAVSEQYLYSEIDSVIKESLKDFFDFSTKKIKKISQTDIDILQVEIDKIEFHDDKIYVMEKISNFTDRVDYALSLIDQGEQDKVPQSKTTLQAYRKQLTDMRSVLIRTQIKDRHYGLFIKYPKEYQG